jgi:hypothetical protein
MACLTNPIPGLDVSHLDPTYQRWGVKIKEITMASLIPHWFIRFTLADSFFPPQLELTVGTQLVSLFSCHFYTLVLGAWFVSLCTKLSTRFLIREDALIAKRRNCQTIEEEQDKIFPRIPKGGPIPRRTGRLTVGRKKNSNSNWGSEWSEVKLSEKWKSTTFLCS